MSVEYGGSLTLGQILPLPLGSNVALIGSLNAQIGDLQPQIGGLAFVLARPPPGALQIITALEQLLAGAQSLLANPLPDVSATATALAALQAKLAAIQAQLIPALSLGSLFSAAGVHFYIFEGQAPELGPELGAFLTSGVPGSPPTAHTAGVICLATDAGAIAAIQAVFGI